MRATILGNLAAAPEVNKSTYGEFLSFRVAESYKDRSGANVTTWVSCTWNGNHSAVLPYLQKGTKVFCYGRVSARTFTGRDGQVHAGLNLAVGELELCGGGSAGTSPQIEKPRTAEDDPADGLPFEPKTDLPL